MLCNKLLPRGGEGRVWFHPRARTQTQTRSHKQNKHNNYNNDAVAGHALDALACCQISCAGKANCQGASPTAPTPTYGHRAWHNGMGPPPHPLQNEPLQEPPRASRPRRTCRRWAPESHGLVTRMGGLKSFQRPERGCVFPPPPFSPLFFVFFSCTPLPCFWVQGLGA